MDKIYFWEVKFLTIIISVSQFKKLCSVCLIKIKQSMFPDFSPAYLEPHLFRNAGLIAILWAYIGNMKSIPSGKSLKPA